MIIGARTWAYLVVSHYSEPLFYWINLVFMTLHILLCMHHNTLLYSHIYYNIDISVTEGYPIYIDVFWNFVYWVYMNKERKIFYIQLAHWHKNRSVTRVHSDRMGGANVHFFVWIWYGRADLKILQHSAENVNYVSSVFVKFVRVSISETLLIIFPLTQC